MKVEAPERLRAEPSAIAPPYMRSTPQFTYCSMSRQARRSKRKRSTTAPSAMVASPNSSPPMIQAVSVPSITRAIDFSLPEGLPKRSAFSAMMTSASRTEVMSIGKKRTITCQPAASSTTTRGQATSVHWAKL